MSFLLRIFDGDTGKVRVQQIATPSVRVGRSESCDVVLPSPFVSRQHALIRLAGTRFLLESVGLNVTELGGQDLPAGTVQEVEPDTEIRIAQYSLFIEAPRVAGKAEVDASERLGEIELELHRELLERVDLSKLDLAAGQGGKVDPRLRQILDELVRSLVPSINPPGMAADVFDHAVHESLYGEVVQEVMRRTGSEAGAERTGGQLIRMDRVLVDVISEFCDRLGVTLLSGTTRQSLRLVDAGFERVYEKFKAAAGDQLQVLLVQRHLMREILNLACGFGPLQDLLELPNTSEIMVVHKDLIYVERDGKLERVHRTFITDELLVSIIQRIVDPLGRRIDRSTPLVDARLPDGSRVNAIIPPLAVKGPCLTIRKFSEDPLTVDDLVAFGSLTPTSAEFLRACVAAHKNLVISGGTGSGKTTLLNVLSSFIAEDERIVTIEDSAELQMRQEHVVTLEMRPPNVEGKGGYTIRDLVRNALRMRPDRVVVGECRGGEALDMLQAMNTGHDGSLTTLHANTPEDALLRLETLVLEAANLPVRAIRDQIASAIQVIVQTQRLPSGKRMVTHIAEIIGQDPDDGRVLTNDIFEEYEGHLLPTGYLPGFIGALIEEAGLDPALLFETSARESADGEESVA